MQLIRQKEFSEIAILIKQSKEKAIKSINTELIDLYWNIGKYIHEQVENSDWGQSVVKELANYLSKNESNLKGFSDKNLWRMKQFFETYSELPKLSPLVREISWTNNLTILTRTKSIDFFIDLLFYHRGLQCLVAFELKADKFKPEHLGQLNFYLEALDRDVRKPNENPSIGILLCKDKDNEVVDYALNRSLSPTMASEYQTQLPDKKLLQKKIHELFDK